MNKEILSYNELENYLKKDEKVFLLLYKKGSEQSDCSFNSLQGVEKQNILFADVNKVRDIHGKFDIKSVPTLLEFENGEFIKTLKGCEPTSYYQSYFENSIFTASIENKEGEKQKKVIVYTTPTCPHCTTVKTHLNKNGIRYTEYNVASDQNAAKEMQRKSGQNGVPQIDIGGQTVVGFDKVKINNLLGI